MQIIGTMLVKNEEHRWLREVLTEMAKVCDRIVVIDDGSNDRTPWICAEFGSYVICKSDSLWATNEVQRRKELWDLAEPEHGDWILCLDADEILVNAEYIIKKAIPIIHPLVDAIGFPLFDMWNDTQYRSDDFWMAHRSFWPMMTKYDANMYYEWKETPLHCGRFPKNAINNMLIFPDVKIKHMGWSNPEDRIAKYVRYMQADSEGKYGWLDQYKSILDKDPNLEEFK